MYAGLHQSTCYSIAVFQMKCVNIALRCVVTVLRNMRDTIWITVSDVQRHVMSVQKFVEK